MSKRLTESEVEYIIKRVLANANDAFEEGKNSNDDYLNGKKLAYYEMLDTIKNELIAREINLERFGLNIELEKLL